jgi:RNA polymerase sigma-70 factor (ECF subfamily)
MENQTDIQLVRAYKNGDEAAFDFLVKRYINSLYRFLFRLCGDADTAEDLVQKTFVNAWRHIEKFDEMKKFKTWLFAIAKNSAVDFFKRKKAIPFSFFEDELGNSPIQNISDPTLLLDDLMDQQDRQNIFSEALNRLPKMYAAILTLHYREDFSLREISEVLEKPYNTVKTYHARALSSLKTLLREDMYPKW